MTNPLGEWEPNWSRIVGSEIWRDEIIPWLKDFEQEEMRKLKDVPDMNTMRRLQGRLDMLSDLMQMPNVYVETQKLEKEREAEEYARRRGFGINFRGRRA